MKTSQPAKNLIIGDEGWSAVAYLDPPGNTSGSYSIGHGHNVLPTERYLLTGSISRSKGLALFESDVLQREIALNSHAKYALNPVQFDSLVRFGFNEGTGAMLLILDTWNTTHDPVATTNRMKLYNKVKKDGKLVVSSDLVARRLSETTSFLSGVGGASTSGIITAICAAAVLIIAVKFS